ncbi:MULTISPECIES: ANTAR domain-containing protein [Streptomyces]|uniref:ANTAR domain-containing protein n=1 Tax=Streptomyces TaxID=1883 RepID=UPI001E3702E6|nr:MULTISPECIES: ANTAR domain-containing protein [Streptomyces]UFQ13764.1 ANTAR domain-containing protein [Streptomyces huasconensis]WCL83359.1 ANTAR domain-containing protein [Streptomyces sp. JCM 35825]
MADHQLVPHPQDEQPSSGHEAAERAAERLAARAQQLQEQVFELEVQLRARPKIALAEGVLVERYGLPDADAAFALMRQASQRANIKLHQVAVAVARLPGPDQGASLWFGERPQEPAPPLTGLGAGTLDARNQGEVLGAALRRVLEITRTHMGNVQLVEDGTLRMEKHTGLPRQFTDHFAFVDGQTACSRAAVGGNQVTVREVASSPGFDEVSRRVILSAGCRGVHSVPLVDDAKTVRGVISSHHPHPLDGFARPQLQALHRTSRAIGRWIDWHRRTVLLDALEDLHQLGLARRQE